ncbi:ergothioneine biosynthesis protein EgtB [Massilia sp. CF038]|uniref:ergothioneine biosynthesis protein EgtB n=1 Tax=Massilia sp. CF038 TaxID=1881045 RepID=UPI00091761BE|nr:ergothioneine biosynthesis protein EgtB [Massilia sp. CF038]SHH03907.1 ergothioneine biosynthesis protein EgtB [Massilia sp. CF038]
MRAPSLAEQYGAVRRRSLQLAEPLSDEDCGAQSMPDASPVKWHLAHTTWFFETFVLEPHEADFAPFNPAFRVLFNSYYNGIGERHPRAQRGLLTRPSMAEVRAYRANVDTRVLRLLEVRGDLDALIGLGLQHEQQHQELLLTDVKHLLAQSALLPAYWPTPLAPASAAPALTWHAFDGGLRQMGHAGDGFCFDNELPRHPVYVAPFELAARLVTNGEYLAFIEAGGYRDPALWLAEGWDVVGTQRLAHPLYWRRDADGQWYEFTLHGEQQLDLARPVTHLSLYEAAACAHWMGARLPTEAEWELAAQGASIAHGALHPAVAGPGLDQLFGACWQWTSSSYSPYPGYASAPGALGEYNGKFMLNQYVLRGASCVTPPGHARASYRNFFPAGARWQFTGLRLAR